MSASKKPILVRIIRAIAWGLSYNWRHTVTLIETPDMTAPASAEPVIRTVFLRPSDLAVRLASVSSRNSPLARAPHKGKAARATAATQRPVVAAVLPKKAKHTTLPTAVAVKNLNRRPSHSASVIRFPVPVHGHRETLVRRAA